MSVMSRAALFFPGADIKVHSAVDCRESKHSCGEAAVKIGALQEFEPREKQS